MIFAYWHKCGFCVKFKPDFEAMAAKHQDIANWAMFDGANEEYLKLTYTIPSFPYIFMLKEDSMYPYLGARDEASIVEFVTSYYN